MMKNNLLVVAYCGISGLLLASPTIYYDLSHLSDDLWQYNYTIENDSDIVIKELTLWFDYRLYSNLILLSSPEANWDEAVIQADWNFFADGLYDAFATTGNEILPGHVFTGLTISFTWLGADLPTSQRFDIVDPGNYAVPIYIGDTLNYAIVVPNPSAILLSAIGVLSTVPYLRKKSLRLRRV